MPSSAGQTCALDRKSTRLNSSHTIIPYAVFCLEKKNEDEGAERRQPHPTSTRPRDSPPPRAGGSPEAPRPAATSDRASGQVVDGFFLKTAPPAKPTLFPCRAPSRA